MENSVIKLFKVKGWSRDMSDRMILRPHSKIPDLETHVAFPPSSLSRVCNKPAPDAVCETVTWKVSVGNGNFKIKVYAGDPDADSRLDLSVNGKIIVRNKKIDKGKMFILEEKMESSKEGFFSFMSECHEDCEEAMSKLSAIEIFPIDDGDNPEEKTVEKELPCGIAFQGGNI